MKKIKILKWGSLFFLPLLFLPIMYVKAKHFWRGETMNQKKVCETWGQAPLDVAKFKVSEDQELIRASMACALLKNQKHYIGKDIREIQQLFGSYSGHYFSDMIPTYLIETAQKRGEDTWQIVFLIDRHEKISQIIVHKNCCD